MHSCVFRVTYPILRRRYPEVPQQAHQVRRKRAGGTVSSVLANPNPKHHIERYLSFYVVNAVVILRHIDHTEN